MTDFFLAQLEREAVVTRRVLQRVPEGRPEWKPHDKSMPLASLASLVAAMPSWIAMMITQDELDLQPPGGPRVMPPTSSTTRGWLQVLDESVVKGREALVKTNDEHLLTPWRLLVAGRVVTEHPRHVMLADTFTHLAHHRGQLSVYLRLTGAAVPPIYGPSADERGFD